MTLSRRAVLPLLLLPLASPAAVAASADDLEQLMARLAAVAERRATFREERTLAALTVPLLSTGRLLYRRPDYLEKDTVWPQPERTVIDGNRLVITDPASNDPPHVVPLDADPGLRALADALRAPLAGDLPALRRGFDVALTRQPPAWTLVLTPRDPAAKRFITTIRVGGTGDWIGALAIEQANGDSSTMQIAPA